MFVKNLAASKFDVCREFCVSAKCAAGNITAAAAFSMVQQPFYTLGNIFFGKTLIYLSRNAPSLGEATHQRASNNIVGQN